MNAVKTFVTIGILVVLIAGITFVTQFISTKEGVDKPPDNPPSGGPEGTYLTFPKTTTETLYSEMTPATGYRDFYFRNATSEPVEVGLQWQSCKCTGVDIRTLNSKEEEKYLHCVPRGAVAQALAAPQQALSFLTMGAALTHEMHDILEPSPYWVDKLSPHQRDKAITVQAEGAGIVRVRWEGKAEGPQRLIAKVWSQPAGRAFSQKVLGLELPMVYVNPINLQPREADIKEMASGAVKTYGFTCFSVTRADFTVSAREDHDDPCIEVHCKPISPEQAAKNLDESLQNAPIRSAYQIEVTVYESRQGRQLDFGAFRRQVLVTTDLMPQPMPVAIKGTVASDFRVVGGDQKNGQNIIQLGLFDADAGKEMNVFIESSRPGTKLAVDSLVPDILKVDLKDGGLTAGGDQQFKMDIKVPAGALNGRVPPDSEIVLKTQDTPPRKIRIPVYGHAVIR